MALATLPDVITRLGRALTSTESDRIMALLEDASAAVIDYTGQLFVAGTSSVNVYPERGKVHLPQRPVTAVDSVEDQDGNAIGFTWYEYDTFVTLGGSDLNRFDLAPLGGGSAPVMVVYDHGYATIPRVIVSVVVGVVLRSLGRSPLDSGVQQQSIAGYSETIGAVGAAGPMGLLDSEKYILNRRIRPARVLAGGW